MNSLSGRVVGAAAVAFALLDLLWLTAANSAAVSEAFRPVLKTACLVAAAGVYVALAAYSALRSESWAKVSFLNSGAAVGLGLVLMMLISLGRYRGSFFHDATVRERLPVLLLMFLVIAFVAALFAPLIGAVARFVHSHRSP